VKAESVTDELNRHEWSHLTKSKPLDINENGIRSTCKAGIYKHDSQGIEGGNTIRGANS
jgi:hypothetical protein